MEKSINFWDKFSTIQNEKEFVEFNYKKKNYYLNRNSNRECKKNFFSLEFSIDQILENNFVTDIEKILIREKVDTFFFRLSPTYKNSEKLTNVLNFLLSLGYVKNNINLMQIDLTKDIKTLRKNLRKRYKSLINNEEKKLNLKFSNIERDRQEIFLNWKKIYSNAIKRGGKYISEKVYNLLMDALTNNQCLIGLVYENNKVLGGMLFSIYDKYSFYSSGVRIPEIENDKKRNIHQFLMWNSILELKKLGLNKLEMGATYDEIGSSEFLKKWSLLEERFNRFKRGFGVENKNCYYFVKKLIND